METSYLFQELINNALSMLKPMVIGVNIKADFKCRA